MSFVWWVKIYHSKHYDYLKLLMLSNKKLVNKELLKVYICIISTLKIAIYSLEFELT